MPKNNLLQRGDIFDLKNGMQVYAKVPERFVYENRPHSMTLTETNVTVGEKLKASPTPSAKEVCKRLEERADSCGISVPDVWLRGLVRESLKPQKTLPKNFTVDLAGEYVVTHTESSGGGTGMGRHDVYPDGWRVTAQRTKNGKRDRKGTIVSFYQTGAFNAMITDVPVKRSLL